MKSAEGGYSYGQSNLGYCYRYGIGTDKDEKKAFEWYLKSAESGYSYGQYTTAVSYQEGTGIAVDEKKAFEWYLRSAENGVSAGQYRVGLCYRNGYGISPNQEKAIAWLQKSKIDNYQKAVDSENLDNSLKKLLSDNNSLISWIPFNELEPINKIGKGGFATVYAAYWRSRDPNSERLGRLVAFKLFHGSKNSYEELVKELIAYSNIGTKNPTFLQCYGISKYEGTDDYILFMQLADIGSLRENLYEVAQMKWEKKLELLSYIASDLQLIHSNNIIHCDLHSGNIFQNNLHSAYIGDLGIAISVNKTLDKESGGIFGALPYMSPEVLQGNSFTKESDIYSFGMIMWEISSGNLVFSNYKDNDSSLATEICLGLRPNILKGTATCFTEIIKRCWDENPNNRPSAIEIHDTILKWKNSTVYLTDFLKSDEEMKIENNGFNNVENSTIYTSQFISYIYQQSSGCIITNDIVSINNIENLR